jgi:hypothetical protein
MEGLWHKNAIVYTVDLQSFADGNGDGVGDFLGLAGKLDYLSGLNVNCLWLQPFFPSPGRDHGYDISDYYGIDPRYGTPGDFVEFSQAARDRGIRVIADLVVNHTSIDHPWFQAARRDSRSKYRNWYVWSKEKPPKRRTAQQANGPKVRQAALSGQRVSERQADEEAARRQHCEDIAGRGGIVGRGCRIDADNIVVVLKIVDAEADLAAAHPRIPLTV